MGGARSAASAVLGKPDSAPQTPDSQRLRSVCKSQGGTSHGGGGSGGWFRRLRTDEMNFSGLKQRILSVCLRIPTFSRSECEFGRRAGCVSVFNGESRVTHPTVVQQVPAVSAECELAARNTPKRCRAAEQTVGGKSASLWGCQRKLEVTVCEVG